MAEQLSKFGRKASKAIELKRASSSTKDQQQQSRAQRKKENPIRISPIPECSDAWVCKNSACRATISTEEAFCKRCSCSICHLSDENKDPSLWLECTSESTLEDSCGLSCHIECALQRGKAGVVDLGLFMQLDGIYCCASCGKVSGLLECWKKQLVIAKDARRIDVLCYRINLSYRLLDGTSKFNELHELVKEAKSLLETEVGPVDGVSANMTRDLVSRHSVAVQVQGLCSIAVQKADELLASKTTATCNMTDGSLPAACKFLFEEVASTSIVILLIELSTSLDDDIKGYKLWYRKTREEIFSKQPVCVFPRDQKRIWISNLQPCTEYSFRIVSYTNNGDSAHSETTCFTKSLEIINKNPNCISRTCGKENSYNGRGSTSKQQNKTAMDIDLDSGFKIKDLGKVLRLALAEEQGFLQSFFSSTIKKGCGFCSEVNRENQDVRLPSVSRHLDLNVASVPDLNEEFTPPVESSRDEGLALEADDDAISNDCQRKNGEVPAVNSKLIACQKRRHSSNREMQDSDSTLTNGSPVLDESECIDENFEYCVRIIRWLECEGHIKKEFRLKLLTWFSLRSTEQERRVVNTFIQTLIDDPISLAGQLVDSFTEIISTKRQRNGLCSMVF